MNSRNSSLSLLVIAPQPEHSARLAGVVAGLKGLQTSVHADLSAGLDWALSNVCDGVVILGGTGDPPTAYDTLWALRESNRLSAPVILISETDDEHAQALESGAADALLWSEVTPALLDRTVRYAVAQRSAQEQLAALQLFDSTTGLPTQLLFWEILGMAVRRAQRAHDHLAVLLIRMDGIDPVLEGDGDPAAEESGRILADRLKSCLRGSDTIARFDERHLVALVEGMPRLEDIQIVAEKILEAGEEQVPFEGRMLAPTATVGIAVYPTNATTSQSLIADASEALYVALERVPGTFQFA